MVEYGSVISKKQSHFSSNLLFIMLNRCHNGPMGHREIVLLDTRQSVQKLSSHIMHAHINRLVNYISNQAHKVQTHFYNHS